MNRQLAFLILCAMLSGCEQKPSGDIVAIVNGDEITGPELDAAMAQIPAGTDRKQIGNVVLDRLVNERLMVQGAKADGLDKSQDYILKARAAENLILASMFVKHTTDSLAKAHPTNVDQFIFANPSRFAQRVLLQVDQIKVPRQAVSDAWLKGAKSLDEVGQVLAAHNVSFERGRAEVDSLGIDSPDFAKIASVPNGRIFAVVQNGVLIFTATLSRKPAPLTGDEASRIAIAILRQNAQSVGLANRVKALRSAAKIDYQPGYAAPGSTAAAAKK